MMLYSQWQQLPLSTRIKIASAFGIEKKGSTEVFNDTIKSDGYFIKDIEMALNINALQLYIGTQETDHQVLWEYLVNKIEGKSPESTKTMSILPKEDAETANKEYELRNPGKTAPTKENNNNEKDTETSN